MKLLIKDSKVASKVPDSYSGKGLVIQAPVDIDYSRLGEYVYIEDTLVLPVKVPIKVTRRQALQALLLAGLLDSIQPAIDAIPDATTRNMIQIEWDESLEFDRYRPSLITLASALGLTSEQLDELFITASKL